MYNKLPPEAKAAIENIKNGEDYLVVYVKDNQLYWRSKSMLTVRAITQLIDEEVKFHFEVLRSIHLDELAQQQEEQEGDPDGE